MYVLFEGEFGEVDRVFRSGDQVDQLTQLGLESDLQTSSSGFTKKKSVDQLDSSHLSRRRGRHLMITDIVEELEQVDVVFLPTEMFLEQKVDGAFQHERVVDGNVPDAGLSIRGGSEMAGIPVRR